MIIFEHSRSVYRGALQCTQSLRLPQNITFVLLLVISLLCPLIPTKFVRTSGFSLSPAG